MGVSNKCWVPACFSKDKPAPSQGGSHEEMLGYWGLEEVRPLGYRIQADNMLVSEVHSWFQGTDSC